MTRWYWQQVGGTLIEEFCAVRRGQDCSNRVIDGVIIKGEEFRIARKAEIDISGKDIVVVQTKASRLGMSLMGQAFFSAQLLKRFEPRSIESVALVAKDDAVLRLLFEQYGGHARCYLPAGILVREAHDLRKGVRTVEPKRRLSVPFRFEFRFVLKCRGRCQPKPSPYRLLQIRILVRIRGRAATEKA
jgi:hypothetical protein